MDQRVLNLSYLDKTVKVVVDDIDKCVLSDVINDMCDEFEKRGWELPPNPGLHYYRREEAIMLIDDKALMGMFGDIQKKHIDVRIVSLEQPLFIWILARRLKGKGVDEGVGGVSGGPNQEMLKPNVPLCASRPKLPYKRNPNTSLSPQSPNQQFNVRRSPRNSPVSSPLVSHRNRLPRMLEEMSCSPPHVSLSQAETDLNAINPSNVRRSPRINSQIPEVVLLSVPQFEAEVAVASNSKAHATATATSWPHKTVQPQETPEPSSPKPKKTKARPVVFKHGKKMPKTTAKYKRLWVSQDVTPEHDTEEVYVSRPRVRDRQSLSITEGSSMGLGSNSDSSEDDYEPQLSSDEGSDDDINDVVDEEENVEGLVMENFVDGGWEPFRQNDDIYDGDGGYLSRLYENGHIYDDVEMGKIRLKPWQFFVDKNHFKDALRDYCVQEVFALVVNKSDNGRFTVECADIRCSWRIHASKLLDEQTWAIKSIKNGHSCDLNLFFNPMVNCDWAASKLLEDIRANPDMKGSTMNELLKSRYGVNMATSTLYKMKIKALQLIQGDHDQSYCNLIGYCQLLKEKNPGSIAFCTWKQLEEPERPLQFKSIFISFKAQFSGVVNGCRGLVGVDGCHLKGNYGGILLSAIALDGNNEIFPLAVAVVDTENKSSWSWFFHHLKNILTQERRDDWTIMSDRQKGIDPSLDEVWPTVSRRYCARHLCKNFKKDYPGVLMHKLFWGVTNAYSTFTFRKALEQVKKHAGAGAIKWLKEVGPLDRWARWSFDPQLCCDENTNNFVESFNSTIGVNRTYPILTMLEGVRRVEMVRHATRQQICENWKPDGICPNIVNHVRVLTKDSWLCHAYPAGRGEYEVSDGRSMLPVSLSKRECVCGRWQISGIPCKHGISAIIDAGKDPLDFVSEWYTVARYKLAYNGNISPIPDENHWPEMDVPQLIPPAMKRSIGRPSRNRRREEGEQKKGKRSTTVQCGNCKDFGHNSQTCKGGATKKEKQAQHGKVPAEKPPKMPTEKGKKKGKAKQTERDAGNLIELMINESQASHSCSQPLTNNRKRKATSEQPSPSVPVAASSKNSKAQKIQNRLDMLEPSV